MNLSKQFGVVGTETWVSHEGSRFLLLPPGSRRAMLALTNMINFEEASDLAPVDQVILSETATDEEKAHAALALKATLEQRLEKIKKKNLGSIASMQARQAACFIVGWENLKDFDTDGVTEIEVPYSMEKAIELCLLYPDFREFINAEVDKLGLAKKVSAKRNTGTKKK
jgi:hypothetical protein